MSTPLALTAPAARHIQSEIARARGNEVCFLARVEENGDVADPRVVARGNRHAVNAAVREGRAGMLVVHNHPSGVLEPSDADFRIAAELHDRGLGLAIVDDDATELYVVVEPGLPKERTPIDVDAVGDALAPGGPLSRTHPTYEDRPAQRDMARRLAELLNDGGIALAEAGTGTGKSLAYLLPAVRHAAANDERVVVSTNTINLQEQLVTKDLPLLRRSIAESFRWALVKGRRNYVSIRRARLAAATQTALFAGGGEGGRGGGGEQQLTPDAELEAILSWIEETEDGSLQDLPFTPSAEVWDEVASETDVCLRAKCPHFQKCFYQRARRDAAGAEVLVVNHALLFSDLAVRRAQGNYTAPAVLPPYRHVILDEAHNLEDAATDHLGASVSRQGLYRLLGRIDRKGKGILGSVEARLRSGRGGGEGGRGGGGTAEPIATDVLRAINEELRPAVADARRDAGELFRALGGLVATSPDGAVRLTDDFAASQDWTYGIETVYENLMVRLDRLAAGLDRLSERVRLDHRWGEALAEQLVELVALANRTRAAHDALRIALRPGRDAVPLVRWLERRGGGATREPNIAACAAPVEIGDTLRDALWDRVDSAALTSATLATKDGFAFLRRRLGLGAGLRVHEAAYPSPFDFETQALVAVPTDLPSPDGPAGPYDLATATVIGDVAAASDGGVFALFTSYRALRAVAAELRGRGLERRWPLFVQGDAPRAHILERFTACGRGVLLGVASFWEGVDVPGDPLRALVITRLPFKVPNEPLTSARIEAIERYGGSGFRDYLLPHAALRLKQGFGRLIRTTCDRGVVVLLDRRVVEKAYGRYFLASLPPAPVRVGAWAEVRGAVEGVYGPEARGRASRSAMDLPVVPAFSGDAFP